jgi:tight adherence protein C
MSSGVLSEWLFFFAFALAIGVAMDRYAQKRQVLVTLRRVRTLDGVPREPAEHEFAALPFGSRVALPALRRAGTAVRRFTPGRVVERLNLSLIYAGSPAGWDAERVLAVKVIALGAGMAGGALIGTWCGLAFARTTVLAALLGFLGYYVPEWIVRHRANARQGQIQRALPDALDLLSITVEAGLAFDAAVARVANQARGPLGEEMHRLLKEMQIGKPRAEALRDLGERSTVPEVKSFVLAMIQADVYGISIARVLHTEAHEMRIRRRQHAEERAQKLQVKIVFPLILCIFPSLFVVLLGPAALTIYHSVLHR